MINECIKPVDARRVALLIAIVIAIARAEGVFMHQLVECWMGGHSLLGRTCTEPTHSSPPTLVAQGILNNYL